jgi:hypothetical protein
LRASFIIWSEIGNYWQDDTGETAMADLKVKFNEMLASRNGRAPLPTAVVHPCSEAI